MKVSNTRVPVSALSIKTQGQSSFAAMQSTNDNSWLLFSGVPLTFPADVLVTSVLGDVVNDTIPTSNIQGPPVEGQNQFPHHAELECVGGSPNTTVQPTCGDFCSSPYKEVPQPVAQGAATESALTLPNITTLYNTSCTRSVPAFDQCGGNEGGCVDCVDAPWPGSCCTSGYSCDRKVSAFWSCSPIPYTTLPNNIAPFDQCGGLLGECANSTAAASITGLPMCTDGPWGGYQCTSNFTCARYGSGYWRCDTVPAKFPTVSGAAQAQSATPQTVGVASTCAAL